MAGTGAQGKLAEPSYFDVDRRPDNAQNPHFGRIRYEFVGWSVGLGLLGVFALITITGLELHGPEWALLVAQPIMWMAYGALLELQTAGLCAATKPSYAQCGRLPQTRKAAWSSASIGSTLRASCSRALWASVHARVRPSPACAALPGVI